MADDAAPSGSHGNSRKVALVAGLGLIAVGAYQLTKGPAKPSSAGTLPNTSGKRQTFAGWLAGCRPDVVAGIQQGRYGDVLGQYLKEQWPDFLSRPDVAQGAFQNRRWDVLGQWLKENAPGYWQRSDVQAGVSQGRLNDVWGQYIRENGGLGCLPTGLAATGGSTATGITPIGSVGALLPGWIIAAECRLGAANWLVVSATPTQFGPFPLPQILAKRWISDQLTWEQLRVSRNVIRLVTPAVLKQLPDGAALKWNSAVYLAGKTIIGGWQGPPPPAVNGTAAGYCG